MKALVLILSLLLGAGGEIREDGGILMMFWNLENFFDYRDGGNGVSDREFSSRGERRWTYRRMMDKAELVAKSLMWVGGVYGRVPDIFAVAEIENSYVLRVLSEETLLRKYGYTAVHYDSPDTRGIDVALLFREERLSLLSSSPVRVTADDGHLRTRDILSACFLTPRGDSIAVLVNHHPSKYGSGDTGARRRAATARMTSVKDSLAAAGYKSLVSVGDFNETAGKVLSGDEGFVNLGCDGKFRGRGTIRYDGKWELIDMFMVTPPLLPYCSMDIVEIPFLMVWDNVHPGMKPLRTYSGPRYLGGVSDHCPVILQLIR